MKKPILAKLERAGEEIIGVLTLCSRNRQSLAISLPGKAPLLLSALEPDNEQSNRYVDIMTGAEYRVYVEEDQID